MMKVGQGASGLRLEYVQGLDRGFAVVRALASEKLPRTIAQVADGTGFTRAVARRYLHTLVKLGYVNQEGAEFSLAPKILELGHAYLSTVKLVAAAPPFMQQLVAKTNESCSMAVLDGPDIVYIARVVAGRLMTINLVVGSRLPAHITSMGNVLLAHLSQGQLNRLLAAAPAKSSDGEELKRHLRQVGEQGWAMSDGQLEEGVRSVAVPVADAKGKVLAALNISAHASRVSMQDLRRVHLPLLQQTAEVISQALADGA